MTRLAGGSPQHDYCDGDRQRDQHGNLERDVTDKRPIDDPRR